MNVKIVRRKMLAQLPSASGLEVVGEKIYAIGDDSPLLYQLHATTWEQQATHPLFVTEHFDSGRIPKPLKPDLECLAGFTFTGRSYLLAFGSGSTPNRNICYVIQLPDMPETPIINQPVSLKKLYQALQIDTEITAGGVLNLEAAATSADHLYLLQRSVNNGPDVLLIFSLPAFMDYLQHPAGALPTYSVMPFRLPAINGFKAGFSGASCFDAKLFITASVENTNDVYLDGEVLGSFTGYIDLNQLNRPICYTARLTTPDGQPYASKVESISIVQKKAENQYQALAITDNDNGLSELLELALTIG